MKSNESISLWPGPAPHALGNDPLRDVPTLTPYWPAPEKATGSAMIICPGGGYWLLADYEGKDYALWLNERGIAAFVLNYRLAAHGYHYQAIIADVFRAIRMVRTKASTWGLDPNRIGIIGSSAGGHLASVAVTQFDAGNPKADDPVERFSSRPDLGVLCYAVISMESFIEKGTRGNLLGNDSSPELVRHFSSELQVRPDTPPCFIWHTQTDPVVRVEHALLFAESLQRQNIAISLHIYPSGDHGIGLRLHGYNCKESEALHPWTTALDFWLKQYDFIR